MLPHADALLPRADVSLLHFNPYVFFIQSIICSLNLLILLATPVFMRLEHSEVSAIDLPIDLPMDLPIDLPIGS